MRLSGRRPLGRITPSRESQPKFDPFRLFTTGRSLEREGYFKHEEYNAALKVPFTQGDIPPARPESLELDVPSGDWDLTDKPGESKPVWREHQSDEDIVNFVDTQFLAAAEARLPLELEWALSLAYREDRHWLKVGTTGHKLVNLQDDEQRHRYVTVPLTNAFCTKVEAMVTVAAPDVQAEGLTDAPLDNEAAHQANQLHAHYSSRFGRINQTKERVAWALAASTSFLKIYWDKQGTNYIPRKDLLTGQRIGVTLATTGDVAEEVLPPFSVYLDPTAKRFNQVRWLIHAEVKPLSWFLDRFGEEGKRVKADSNFIAESGYVDRYLRGIELGTTPSPASAWNNTPRLNGAVCKEYWELPSTRYPEGRYLIVAGKTLLYAGNWPYTKKDSFPFIPLGYKKQAGSPYHRSLAIELWGLNLVYDRIFSQVLAQSEGQVDRVLVPIGAEIGADAYEDRNYSREIHKIYYNPNQAGGPPRMERVHGIATENLTFLETIEAKMRDIAGVHDVSQGLAPAGTPAEAVRILQQADQTQHAQLRSELEESMQRTAEWEVALAQQFLPAASIIGLIDDKGFPQRAEPQQNPLSSMPPLQDSQSLGMPPMQGAAPVTGMDASASPSPPIGGPASSPPASFGQEISLAALREGGQPAIRYIPGSSFADSPDQKQQKYAQWYQLGIFGPPGSPDASKIFLTLSDDPRSNDIVKMIDAAVAHQMQMQQEMMQAQAQAQQGPDPQAQLDAMGQQAGLTEEHEQNLAAIEIQKKQALSGIDVNKAQNLSQIKGREAAVQNAQNAQQTLLQETIAERQHERQKALQNTQKRKQP